MDIYLIVLQISILLFSVTIHEVSHGLMAERLGDDTAKRAGRLTLNPLKHLDLVGSFLVPLALFLLKAGFIIGWAKPVPVNPFNFRDQKYGQAKVAVAGPLSNLTIALFFGLILRFVHLPYPWFGAVAAVFVMIILINLVLAVFNLTPLPPFDGSHILFAFLGGKAKEAQIFLTKYSFALLF
ncbi:MAG: site-2 protease family protein, partial [bacterium]|nr:site-2 protease family protein [bacterium]